MKRFIFILLAISVFISCSRENNQEKVVLDNDPYITEQIFKVSTDIEPPQFELENMKGDIISLNDYKGKVLFLNFWASWCGPCVHEMPSIERLKKHYENDEDVEILLVNLGEDRETVENFLNEGSYTVETLLDKDNMVGTSYGVRSIPTTIIFNKDGMVVASKTGAHEWDRDGVKAILDSLK